MASSAFFDRIWCPARPPPITDHGGLGEKGEKVASFDQTPIIQIEKILFEGLLRIWNSDYDT